MHNFVHLHVHTQYSLLDGQASIPRLVEVAATGVDYLSVGALTHTVKGMDISMNIQVEK